MTSPAVLWPERALPTDAVALSCIGRDTFTDKFGHLYTPENLNSFLDEAHSAEWYEYALSAPDVAVWGIRDGKGGLAAYAVAGANTLPIGEDEPDAGELKRIYVRTEYQGKGLGGSLLGAMIGWLRGREFGPLYVGVYEDNEGAQKLYRRLGFEQVSEYIFPVGTHQDRELIFRLDPPDNMRVEPFDTIYGAVVDEVTAAAFGGDEEVRIIHSLHDHDDILAEYIALSEDRVVGHVALSRMTIEGAGRELTAACLAPVSVVPDMQGRGIGAWLCERALAEWDRGGTGISVVLGHPEYYPRFGFSAEAAARHLQCPFGDVGPAYMLRDFQGQLADMSAASVEFPRAFNLP